MNEDETTPASIEDFSAISPEYWAELDALYVEVEQQREFLNLVPLDKGGERYIRERYPVTVLYARADLQDIAESDYDTVLTETEIQAVQVNFFGEYPEELHLAITNAIECVIQSRSKKLTVEQGSLRNTDNK